MSPSRPHSFCGADPEALDALATRFRYAEALMREIAAEMRSMPVEAVWAGADQRAVHRDLRATARRCLDVASLCAHAAEQCTQQARQQRDASSPDAEPAPRVLFSASEAQPPPARMDVIAAAADRMRYDLAHGYGNVEVLKRVLDGEWFGGAPADAQLLEYANDGRGQVVVAHVPIDEVAAVAVYVPGTGASLERAPSDLGRGERLQEALGPDVAVVTWIGYESPTSIWPTSFGGIDDWYGSNPLRRDFANRGAVELARFLERFDESVDVSLIGHSYGALVVAGAATRFGGVDSMVLMGAPGVGVWHRRDLAAEEVIVAAAPDDQLSLLPVFGPPPATDRFGATVLEVPDGAGAGHGGYLAEGSGWIDVIAERVRPRSR